MVFRCIYNLLIMTDGYTGSGDSKSNGQDGPGGCDGSAAGDEEQDVNLVQYLP